MKLCVLVWILETMQMEFPEYGQHFRKCWDLDHPVMDEEEGQRKYEQDQKGLLDWDDMLKPVKVNTWTSFFDFTLFFHHSFNLSPPLGLQ